VEVSAIASVALAWAVVVLVPGPDFLATAQAAAGTSRRAGIAVVAGIAVATTVWALAAVAGLGAVFRTSAWIYDAVRLAGAAYLVVLGVGLLVSSRRPRQRVDPSSSSRRLTLRRAFVRGLVTDLSNPKAAVFFTSLFAVAIPPGSGPGSLLVVVALIPAIAALWYGSVAVVLASGPLQRAYRRAERAVLAVAGALLAAFGVRLALER
jgi:threonine efflux protein